MELADTLVDDFDVVDLLALLVDRSVELLDASAAGIVLVEAGGALPLMASTSEAIELVELFQVQNEEGPCLDCSRSGRPVVVEDLAAEIERWPRFVPFALDSGFRAAHALPMRLRGRILGALNLFRSEPGGLGGADITAGQALADVATIAVLQTRAVRDAHVVADQLEEALQSRVAIEQAKGMLAEQADIGTDEAFSRLRGHARQHRRLLADVAQDVVRGRLLLAETASPAGGPGRKERPSPIR